MHAGLGLLRLSPRDFWAMTPREFQAALGVARRHGEAPGRSDLARLMAEYPDRDTKRQ